MAEAPAAGTPKITSFEDFDVFSGKSGLSRSDYKESTFHTAEMADGDASFKRKAELMESSGSELSADVDTLEASGDKKEEAVAKK